MATIPAKGYGKTSRRTRLLWLPADLLRSTISLRIRQSRRRGSRSFGENSPSSTRLTSALSMTSPDLGSAFTACPDDTPKGLQVWFSAPITCACPTVAETVALLSLRRCFGVPLYFHPRRF